MDIALKTLFRFILILTFPLLLLSATGGYATPPVLRTTLAEESPNGINHAILEAIGHRLGVKLSYRTAAFQRRLFFMKNGTVDFMIGLLKRPDREAYIHFLSPPYKRRSDTVFFLPSSLSSGTIRTYEDLKKLRIGVVNAAHHFEKFDADITLKKEKAPNLESNFHKLLLGRVDAIISSETGGIDLIHRMGRCQGVRIADFRYSRAKEVYVGISKKSKLMAELPRLEQVIGGMIQEGEIHRIIVEYYTQRDLPVPAI
ncbi:MAG: transporter substrate-binding domain-containing protein [Desulfobacterales bacterium]|nr:transporter substrate-binding domain-containing protein [Desulfobacterales bacterium]